LRLPSIPLGVVDFALRVLRRFLDVEGPQQATVISAQAFTSLIPFLVVGSALAPGSGDLADKIVDRFNLSGDAADSVAALFNTEGEVESAITWFSVLILVLATLSFTRAMQRMFQRAYREQAGGPRDMLRGYVWLAGFALWIVVSSPLRETLSDVGGPLTAVVVTAATGLVLWLWTPAILLGTRDWRRLLPGAIVSGALGLLISVASGIYIPILMNWSAEKYGLIGIAFSMQSWLLVMSFVVVVGAVVGAVASEDYGEHIRRLTRRRERAGRVPLS
jgi:membrane protein